MRPAGNFNDLRPRVREHCVVAGICIGMQVTRVAFQEFGRAITTTTVGEVIYRVRVLRISDVRSEVPLETSVFTAQHCDVRIVGPHHR